MVLSIRRPHSGRGRLSRANIFWVKREGDSSDADVCTFWRKKLRIFRNLWCVRTDKGGRASVDIGHLADKEGGGQFFAILCRRLLWTAPCLVWHYKTVKSTPLYSDTLVQANFVRIKSGLQSAPIHQRNRTQCSYSRHRRRQRGAMACAPHGFSNKIPSMCFSTSTRFVKTFQLTNHLSSLLCWLPLRGRNE